MSILRCLLILSALTSLLVTGPNMVPVQSHAAAVGDNGGYKTTKDYKDSIQKDVNAESDSTNQHSGQDNFAYRSDDPSQANQGQQITGKDNEAKGFNDQSSNLQSTPATAGAVAGGTGNNGNGTLPTPPTGTLSVCKVVIDNTGFGLKPSDFTFAFTSEGADPAEFPGSADCTKVTVPEGPYSFGETPIREFPFPLTITVSGDCTQVVPNGSTFHGSIKDGETQTCTVTNKLD